MKPRFVPREGRTEDHFLEAQPSRDNAAIILPIAIIKVGSHNPRADLGDLTELKDSIVKWGVLQPVLVAKNHTLIAGHRRLAAAKLAGLAVIPVRIIHGTEDSAALIAMIENINREDLDPMSEILGVAKLVHIFEGNQVELAEALGKSKAYVSKCIKAAAFIRENPRVSDRKLSRAMLFELAYSPDPITATEAVSSGAVTNSRDLAGRKPSGALPGGRAVANAIHYRERRDGSAFTLRLHFDQSKTPEGDKQRIITQLESILSRLRG